MKELSRSGWAGFILAASMILSMYGAFRISVGDLLVHPYLALLPILILVGKVNILKFKNQSARYLLAYGVIFSGILMMHDLSPNEVFKIFAGIFSFHFFVKAIKSKADYRYPAFALVFFAFLLSLRVMFLGTSGEVSLLAGVNVLDQEGLGNKNAQSLYVLPGLFFLFYFLSDFIKRGKYIWSAIFSLMLMVVLIGIAYSGNRSGYLGVLVIVVTFIFSFKLNPKLLIFIPLLAYGSYVAIDSYASDVVTHKYEQTTGAYESDNQRLGLIKYSLILGLENPVAGLGYYGLAYELARRLNSSYKIVDTHNIYGYLFGGGGIMPFLLFLAFGYTAFRKGWQYLRRGKRIRYISEGPQIGLWLCGFVVLYFTRGAFTREILYSPTFMGGLGIMLGALLYYEKNMIYRVRQILSLSNFKMGTASKTTSSIEP